MLVCAFFSHSQVGRNICHGSDSVESANREIGLWFPEGIAEWVSYISSYTSLYM